jgi:acetolactate synthase-1/2/3 large subunit
MKGSDIVASYLREHCLLDYVFGLQGGAVVHLFDSCERIGPKPIYCHHEQAAGFAACAYARVKGFAACIVTTGPGATNAVTPLLGAFQDSLPVMFISGQTRSQHLSYDVPGVRQIGTQEAPICDIVGRITKVTFIQRNIETLRQSLQTAYNFATMERPGPVWIDLPLDIQYATYSG